MSINREFTADKKIEKTFQNNISILLQVAFDILLE